MCATTQIVAIVPLLLLVSRPEPQLRLQAPSGRSPAKRHNKRVLVQAVIPTALATLASALVAILTRDKAAQATPIRAVTILALEMELARATPIRAGITRATATEMAQAIPTPVGITQAMATETAQAIPTRAAAGTAMVLAGGMAGPTNRHQPRHHPMSRF